MQFCSILSYWNERDNRNTANSWGSAGLPENVTPKVTELLIGLPNQAAPSKRFSLLTFNCRAGMGGQVQSPVMVEFQP